MFFEKEYIEVTAPRFFKKVIVENHSILIDIQLISERWDDEYQANFNKAIKKEITMANYNIETLVNYGNFNMADNINIAESIKSEIKSKLLELADELEKVEKNELAKNAKELASKDLTKNDMSQKLNDFGVIVKSIDKSSDVIISLWKIIEKLIKNLS